MASRINFSEAVARFFRPECLSKRLMPATAADEKKKEGAAPALLESAASKQRPPHHSSAKKEDSARREKEEMAANLTLLRMGRERAAHCAAAAGLKPRCDDKLKHTCADPDSCAAVAAQKKPQHEQVFIDRTTEVPLELYLDLVEAGRKARARGQHYKARSRSTSSLIKGTSKPRLVMSKSM